MNFPAPKSKLYLLSLSLCSSLTLHVTLFSVTSTPSRGLKHISRLVLTKCVLLTNVHCVPVVMTAKREKKA